METARELSSRLHVLLRREQSAQAEFLLALAAFDERRAWVDLGYSSLFHYLHRELGMSKGAAHYRKTAAELINRVPAVVQPLREGVLCITSIIELAKVLTPENQEEVLPRFFHCSRQEAKAVSAELRPAEVVPARTVVTPAPRVLEPLPAATAPCGSTVELMPAAATSLPRVSPTTEPAPRLLPPTPSPRSAAEPLTADLRRLHVTVSRRFMEKLEAVKDALSHSHPGADVEAILEAGLDALIERAAKRKGLVKRPRAAAPPADVEASENARYVPAAVRREVWLRDEGRCQWPTSDGGICGSTHRCELDHIVPVGRRGRSVASNLRVACAFHNDLAAREVYGDEWMDAFTRAGRRGRDVAGDSGGNRLPAP
jgi:hypothetical protein